MLSVKILKIKEIALVAFAPAGDFFDLFRV